MQRGMQRAMRSLRALAATTAFRWTLAIAGGFTAMALSLFAFIYWQTAVHEQGRIDGIVLSEARSIADAPGGEAVSRLETWLAVRAGRRTCGRQHPGAAGGAAG